MRLLHKTAVAALAQTTIAIFITACGGGGGEIVVIPPETSSFTKSYSVVVGAQAVQLDLGTLLVNATISNIVGLPTGAVWNATSNSISVSPATSGNTKNNPYTRPWHGH